MRINKINLAGLAAAILGASAGGASAEDLPISTATNTPVRTSDPVAAAPVAAGNITIQSGGSITVTAGQDAVTIDSNNDVAVQSGGSISSNDADNVNGILLEGGADRSVTHAGTISLLESYVLADANNDGDLDGAFALGTDRHAIHLEPSALAFDGDITSSGAITVEGNNSSGITLDAVLDGSLTTSGGSITIQGDNSAAIAINGGALGGVTGDVILRNSVAVRGENSSGLVVNAEITGGLIINGSWTVTGFHDINRPSDISTLDPDDLLIGGSAVAVHYSVAGGIVIEGIGVEDDTDDDDDLLLEGVNNDTNDDASAAIAVYGSAPALLIQADPSANLVLGTTGTGFGLHVQGTVTSFGVFDNIDATAIRIEGSGGATVSIADGVALDGPVQAVAINADSYAIVFGAGANVFDLLVRRALSSFVTSDLAQTAHGVVIEVGATLPSMTNSSTISVQTFGEVGDATAILDASGTLTTINNSGAIITAVVATDADLEDGIPPPPVTGSATAIDVSANISGVTLNQTADAVFTDEDGTDDDATLRPDTIIRGDILFGSGGDTINLLAGAILGDVVFGGGADLFLIDNGASYAGVITDSGGDLTIDVQDGTLVHGGGTLNFTSATFAADAVLGVTLSEVPGETTFMHASQTVTFDPGSEIIPVVPVGLPVSGTHTFLTADLGLNGAANVIGDVTGVGAPFLYNLNIDTVLGDPNSLQAAYIMKTAAQLGLNSNQTIAFDHIVDALRLDDGAAAAFASLDSEATFFDAYADLMPTYASAVTELATTAIQQMQSATTNRMAYTRLQELDEVSVWVQEIAYGLSRTPIDVNAQEFRGHGFGLAVGIDGPLNNGALFGLSASFLASEAEEPARPEGEVSTWFGQGNAYLGTAIGPIDLDFVGGAGFGKMRSRRFVEIGQSFSAQTEAEWWSYEAHGAARASVPLAVSDWFVLTPQAALTYVGLGEEGYTESGGGVAIDLEADESFTQRLWADAGVEISGRWTMRGGGVLAPRLYAGYRTNVIDEEAERTFRYVSGGTDFTLIDAPLGDGGPLVGIGIDATNGYSTFSLAYEGELGDEIERHSLNASIRFRF